MTLSVFDLFKIGIGPSSSHTVGPMRAARRFAQTLESRRLLDQVARVRTALYGALALTGRGHATDRAILLGLSGEKPDAVDPDNVEPLVARIRTRQSLRLLGGHEMTFHEAEDLLFHKDESLPRHPNGIRMAAFDRAGAELAGEVY
jgi:L-serine dehydratase